MNSDKKVINVKKIHTGLFLFFIIYACMQNKAHALFTYCAQGKMYIMEQILSDYQYFIENEAVISGHTYGAIAVGKKATIKNGFGESAVVPSYFGNINGISSYNVGECFLNEGLNESNSELYGKYQKEPVYYKSVSKMASRDIEGDNFVKASDYISFTNAFEEIREQSKLISECGHLCSEAELKMYSDVEENEITFLKIDFEKYGHFITIPENIYLKCDAILLSGLELKDCINQSFVISILADDVSLSTAFWNIYPGDEDRAIMIETSEEDESEVLQGENEEIHAYFLDDIYGLKGFDDEGSICGGMVHLTGMKMIWNFPETSRIATDNLPGHIVAPNGRITMTGNDCQGNIIAQNINVMGTDAYFYPFTAVGERVEKMILPAKREEQASLSVTEGTETVEPSKMVVTDTPIEPVASIKVESTQSPDEEDEPILEDEEEIKESELPYVESPEPTMVPSLSVSLEVPSVRPVTTVPEKSIQPEYSNNIPQNISTIRTFDVTTPRRLESPSISLKPNISVKPSISNAETAISDIPQKSTSKVLKPDFTEKEISNKKLKEKNEKKLEHPNNTSIPNVPLKSGLTGETNEIYIFAAICIITGIAILICKKKNII